MKRVLILGAGGFIGGALVCKLLEQGCDVVGVDIKEHDFLDLRSKGCDFIRCDLRNESAFRDILKKRKHFDEVYQFAADMGGAGHVFTGLNDADIMHNSCLINLNVLNALANKKTKIFYASSACVYPAFNQLDPNNPNCKEETAFPAQPDSAYGLEKLFSEQLYDAFARNKNLNVRIARFHNIFGPYGTYAGGREKAPAAMCRKIAALPSEGGEIEIWGDGEQTRSFLYIDECLEAVSRLMNSPYTQPTNIGSEEMVTINQLAQMVAVIANKNVSLRHIEGPLGVRGRCSDNTLIEMTLGWKPTSRLVDGLSKTYLWINQEMSKTQ